MTETTTIIASAADAVEIARAYAERRGFKLDAASNISEAMYLRAPGYADNLRIACHACHHAYGVAFSLEMYDDDTREMMRPTFGYNVTGYSVAEVEALAQEAIDEYFTKAEPDEEDDD